jgi:hypothetical protein
MRIEHLRRLAVGDDPAIGVDIVRRVETQTGLRGDAYPVVRNRAENDGARREAQAVDDDRLAGRANGLISIKIGPDLAAAIIRNPNSGLARIQTCREEQSDEQNLGEVHIHPQFFEPDGSGEARCLPIAAARPQNHVELAPGPRIGTLMHRVKPSAFGLRAYGWSAGLPKAVREAFARPGCRASLGLFVCFNDGRHRNLGRIIAIRWLGPSWGENPGCSAAPTGLD